jgi:hypothetical protein
MALIHKSVSPFGDWIIFLNGKMLYKKWPGGRSVVFEAYGPPTSNHDRDNGTTLTEETAPMAHTVEDDMLSPSQLYAKRFSGMSEETGSDGVPSDKAKALFHSVVSALAWTSEENIAEIDVAKIRDHLHLKGMIDLADPGKYPTMPMEVRAPLRGYILSLPGFYEWMGHKQTDETYGAHAVIEGQLTAYLVSIAGVYALLLEGSPMPGMANILDSDSEGIARNPFRQSGEALANMVGPLLPDICDDDEIVARAKRLFTIAADALYWMVDEKIAQFDFAELRDHFNLNTLIDLNDPFLNPTIPMEVRGPIREYLYSIPGFRPEMGYNQTQEAIDSHRQSEMTLTKLLGSLVDTYGYIFCAPPETLRVADDVYGEGGGVSPKWRSDLTSGEAASNEGAAVDTTESPMKGVPEDIVGIVNKLGYDPKVAYLLMGERMRWQDEIERLRKAADYISPYLRYTVGEESPGHHPTMPSAVAAFHVAFDIDTPEKRATRIRSSLKGSQD